jgi:hypothetical protein
MGTLFACGRCLFCGRSFAFHPDRVPALVIQGVREPVRRSCVERAHPVRTEKGPPEIVVLPGAYAPGQQTHPEPSHKEGG